MGGDGSSAGRIARPPAGVLKLKGNRSKRRFLPNVSLEILRDPSLNLTHLERYKILEERLRIAYSEMESLEENSDTDSEETEEEEFKDADWEDPVARQLEELLAYNLLTIFGSAIKKIVELGYTEEAAGWAVLNAGLCHGSKDPVSNIVAGALALMKREEHRIPSKPVFEGLQSLVEYIILEATNVILEIRPDMSITEALWCLLISDMSLSKACVMEGGSSGGSRGQQVPGESPEAALSPSKPEASGTSHSNSKQPEKPLMPDVQSSHPKTPITGPAHQLPTSNIHPGDVAITGKAKPISIQEAREQILLARAHVRASSQVTDEKSGSCRKPLANSNKDVLRQKTCHFENYKGHVSKGDFKAKTAASGNTVLDNSWKLQSGSSGVLKIADSKLSTSAETNDSHLKRGHNPLSNSQSGVPPTSLPVKDTAFVLPEVNSESPAPSVQDPDPCPKGKIHVSGPSDATDCDAAIPYDENLLKYFSRGNNDETILILETHKQALEQELHRWTNWTNEKVMQAARRLSKEQGELKALRQEKEESEKFFKDKQTVEDSIVRRLSEMENALTNTNHQIEVSNSSLCRLKAENSFLKNEVEAAKLQALKSATNLQKAMMREQEALKKSQSLDAEKGSVLDELTKLKRVVAGLNHQREKINERQDQFKVLFNHEEKEKLKAATKYDSLRAKKEIDDAATKQEADNRKRVAEINMQKCQEDIKNLENKISELRLGSYKSEVAALSAGYGISLTGNENISIFKGFRLPKITKRLAAFQNNFAGVSVKPERECVMCMAEEISVVFLPCAHQILCEKCSAVHEKEGMNDCPTCRTPVEKRISVQYRQV